MTDINASSCLRASVVRQSAPVLALLAYVALGGADAAATRGADAPGYAIEPNLVEYDVDPTWPQRPDQISGKGWVSGLAVDADDNVWFFRKGPDPVQVYRPDGTFVRSWGRGNFQDPHQLRIDYEGNVWVADFGLHVVEKYSPEGRRLMTLGVRGESGSDRQRFYRPTDMAITPAGDIFVTDGYGNRRIVHFDKDGNFIKAWGEYGSKPGQFVLPHAIAVDKRGLLYVADRNSGRIQIFKQDGTFVDQWEGILMPWGISINARDEIWTCGSSPHWWRRHGQYPEYKDQLFMLFSPDGRVRRHWAIPLGDIGEDKNNPDTSRLRPGEAVGVHCIAQDSHGNLYVGDIYGERAQKFIPVTARGADD